MNTSTTAQLGSSQSSADIGEPANWRESAIVRLIDILRSEEGDSVTILSDNPDFNGQPNCAVICNGDWTGWVDKRFAADTVLDALSMAMTEKKLPAPRKVIAESNGHHWVERFHLVCCRDCGFVRRSDDQNKPCKGVVTVGPRASLQPATPVEAATPCKCCRGLAPASECQCELERKAAGHPPYSRSDVAQASQDEMENYRLALAWIKGQSTDPQAKEIAATALDSCTHSRPDRKCKS